MALNLQYGFYNSRNGDRKYDAKQMSRLFSGIITDGVFQNVGEAFAVTANTSDPEYVTAVGSGTPDPTIGSELSVMVGSGRAWFNETWSSLNEESPLVKEQLNLDISDLIQPRIDVVALQVCKATNNVTITRTIEGKEVTEIIPGRTNRIIVVKGTPAEKPTATKLHNSDSDQVYEHALAQITVRPRATHILQSDIKSIVGTKTTPYIAGAVDTSGTVAHWSTLFQTWLAEVQDVIDENAAANLLMAVNTLSANANLVSNATRYYLVKALKEDWLTTSAGGQNVYYIDIEVPGMTSGFIPGIPILHADGNESASVVTARRQAYSLISRVETLDGKIRLYAYDAKPNASMNLYIPGITNKVIPVSFANLS